MSHFATLSLPDDAVRGSALLAAVMVPLCLGRGDGRRRWLWPWVLAPACAAVLSVGYVAYYLRGGPRIIDATSYWLQARTMAAGMFTWPVTDPAHASLGRFILAVPHGDALRAGVIFPPGYPAVLALGFAVGMPLAVGPLLAAALVLATAALARAVARRCYPGRPMLEAVWVSSAATMSLCCAALRYHTADTMSHGLAALCFTAGLVAVLRGGAIDGRVPLPRAVLGGLAAGLLLATRPASAVALATTAGATLWLLPDTRRWLRPRAVLGAMVGAAPAVALWLAYQHALTGEWLGSAQHAYYATSDGPPGCFRYGFGAGIGCLGEHRQFVEHALPDGYGFIAAAGTTLRRLKLHLTDALNLAPLFALVALGAASWRRRRALAVLTVAPLAQVASYAPFYFDGSYPGGGARMLAEVLPVEQVLAFAGLLALTGPLRWRGRARRLSPLLLARVTVSLMLLGFALRTGALHAQLRDREGGRPMFEASKVDSAPSQPGLVLLDTDHGFNLAFDPTRPEAVARFKGDGLDRLVWALRGRPRSYRYRYLISGPRAGRAWLEPLHHAPESDAAPLRVEAESLWPPAEQRGGWVWPEHAEAPCAGGGRVLRWRTSAAPRGRAGLLRLRLPAALSGRELRPTLAAVPGRTPAPGDELVVELLADGELAHRWRFRRTDGGACPVLSGARVPDHARRLSLLMRPKGDFALDSLSFGKKR